MNSSLRKGNADTLFKGLFTYDGSRAKKKVSPSGMGRWMGE